MIHKLILPLLLALGLTACANPYDPGQRAASGALLGAGIGALMGVATTPERPHYR